MILHDLLHSMPTLDQRAFDAVQERAAQNLRPAGAFARLDAVAAWLGGWQRTAAPRVSNPKTLVFAADHGVAADGVSAYPIDVTPAMLAAVEQQRATITALGRALGVGVSVFDVGVSRPTANWRHEPAMTEAQFDEVTAIAVAAVDAVAESGCDLLVVGELGIGNTTTASAIAACILGGDPRDWVGRGTGVDDEGLARKASAVSDAQRRTPGVADPIDLLRQVGGFELVAMAGAVAQARRRSLPVVLDGFVVGAAVLPLFAVDRSALDHCIAGHRSAEAAHGRLLAHLGLDPLLSLDLRLGEGSGALLAVPIVKGAAASVVDVATFAEWFGITG